MVTDEVGHFIRVVQIDCPKKIKIHLHTLCASNLAPLYMILEKYWKMWKNRKKCILRGLQQLLKISLYESHICKYFVHSRYNYMCQSSHEPEPVA